MSEMILCDDGPDEVAEDIKDIFKTQNPIRKSPITVVLETQDGNIKSSITVVLGPNSKNVESSATEVLKPQSESLGNRITSNEGVESLNQVSNISKAGSDVGEGSTVNVDILEPHIASEEGCKKLADILETQSDVIEENCVTNTDDAKTKQENEDSSKVKADILETQSKCNENSKENANIIEIESDNKKDTIEITVILDKQNENVEISEQITDIPKPKSDEGGGSKEMADMVDIQSDIEDNCMEISDTSETQKKTTDDSMDGCLEIDDGFETQNENVEDPIKITGILEAKCQTNKGCTDIKDIIEIQSDNEESCLENPGTLEPIHTKIDTLHKTTEILETQTKCYGSSKESANIVEIQSDYKKDTVEITVILEKQKENVEISTQTTDIAKPKSYEEESSKEIANMVDKQCNVENTCMKISDISETHKKAIDDPVDGCMEIDDVFETQNENVEDPIKTTSILDAQCQSITGSTGIKDIIAIQDNNKESCLKNPDTLESEHKKIEDSHKITDILETQSKCNESSKETANIIKIHSDIKKGSVEITVILDKQIGNVEISKEAAEIQKPKSDEEGSKEIVDMVDKQCDIEDTCMEIEEISETQKKVIDDPLDGCTEIAGVFETQNENVEDPIKIPDILETQSQSKGLSTDITDIIEIHSDNEESCLENPDPLGAQLKKKENSHKTTDILETQIDGKENRNDSSKENTNDFQKITNEDKETVVYTKNNNEFKFKKRLIKAVRKEKSLYDTRSKGFGKLDTKMKAWQNISAALKKDAEVCKQTWVDLRYDYQQYVRKLRKFLRSGNVNKKKRPVMVFERELLFLWRFVAESSRCPITQRLEYKKIMADITSQTLEDDDVVLVEDEPVLVINLEDNEDSDEESKKNEKRKSTKNECKITFELRKLVELIKEYPELYDISHPYYNNFGRRGFIWSALANELRDKATKLMKLWIYVQTRYEWEINTQTQTETTELQELLEFMKPNIIVNPNTVYKQSLYLRGTWQEPIEAFKIIFQLLATMRKYPKLIDTTITKHTLSAVLNEYKRQWSEIGELRGFPPGQCETTWLIMRSFYWELINMRKNSYQLQDKWYFESIISELYTHTDQSKNKSPEPMDVDTDIYAKSYAYSDPIPETSLTVKAFANSDLIPESPLTVKSFANSNPIPETSLTVKAFANTSALPKTFNNGSQEKQRKSKTAGAAPLKGLPPAMAKKTSPFSMQLPSTPTPVTKTKATVLPRHTVPVTFETELAKESSPAMVSIDISSSPSPPPIVPPLVPITTQSSSATTEHITPSTSDALSSNEILIELVASFYGNMLIINEATKKYSLNMNTTAKFIREVMAIPFLHNKELPASAKYNHWVFISNRFGLPHHIAIACWDFLLENFKHFDQIAPMEKLMAPFPNFKVWKENTKPFQNFHSYAVKKGWFTYMKNLPVLMIEMSKYPELYDDALATRNSTVPLALLSKFPNIQESQITEICTAFKNAFVSYMKDLEQGIANKWPEQWWHVLEKLQFLVEERYSKFEPFYYIVKNKIQEEIERHRELEKQKVQQTHALKQKSLAANGGKAIAKTSATPIQKSQTSTIQKSKPYQVRANVDPYSLILAIRRHPNIYENCTNQEKLEAWTQVAQKMNTSVAVCRQNFQRAFRDYRLYIHRDPAARCRLNHRYFKQMQDIYRTVKTPSNKLSIKTPTELNQSLAESNETVFPERFIVDINMDNSNPALVMKNWSYAIGNLHVYTQDSMQSVLRSVFNKYRNQSVSS